MTSATRGAYDPRRSTDSALRRLVFLGGVREADAYWAFSVDDDLRVLFRWNGDEAFLVILGTHDQV